MNYDQHVAASFQAGFDQRLRQMVIKSAMTKRALDPRALWQMASQATRAGKSLGRVGNQAARISPKFQMPGVMSTDPSILRSFGSGTTSAGAASRMTGLARGTAGKPFVDPLAAAGRFARGSNLAQAARTGQLRGAYKSPVTGRAMPAPGNTPKQVKPVSGFARLSEPLPAPPAAPKVTPPPGAAPGTVTPDAAQQAAGVGAVPPPGAASPAGGDPTGGLLGTINNSLNALRGKLPPGAVNWMDKHPGIVGGAAGGGAVFAGDQFGDWRRRKAIENLGFMDRLGLAFQLAASPRGFNQTLGL